MQTEQHSFRRNFISSATARQYQRRNVKMNSKHFKIRYFLKGGVFSCALQLGFMFIIGIWVCVPLLMYYFPVFAIKGVFLNIYYCPLYTNMQSFETFGLSGKYNRIFYQNNTRDNLKLGFWHLIPDNLKHGNPTDDEKEKMLSNGDTVILYLHGNALNRGGRHMVDLYKKLTALNYHVIAVDYRGYGDSEGSPRTEDEVVSDAMTAWNYVKKATKSKSKVYVWGHSLGTAISSSLVRSLYEKGENPRGLILESPFTSMREGIVHHPLSYPYRSMPYFHEVFVKSAERNGIYFNTIDNVLFADCPILILHSKDDHILPYHFALSIEGVLKEHQRDVELHLFPEGKGYFHVDLCRDPSFSSKVQNFIVRTSSNAKLQ